MCRCVLFRPGTTNTFYCELIAVLRNLSGSLELLLVAIGSVRSQEDRFARTIKACF